LERVVERDLLALFQPELAWGLLRGLLGAGELGVRRNGAGLQRLKGDVGGHQLGERGGEPGNVGILGGEYGAVIGLEEERGGGGSDRRSHQDRSDEEANARASRHRSWFLFPHSIDRRRSSLKAECGHEKCRFLGSALDFGESAAR